MKRALVVILAAGCGSSSSQSPSTDGSVTDGVVIGDSPATTTDGTPSTGHRTVLVVPFENKDSVEVYGDTTDAPYLNGLLASAAYATNFMDELAISIPSEPHYIWMEAGTNTFADRSFTTDSDPSASNSTASKLHLSTQIEAAGLTWTAYQEGITTGTCPIKATGEYAPKHDPFVFFQDVVGATPSASSPDCATHHKSIADLPADLAAGTVANYAFITPNLCNDMHGDLLCPSGFSVNKNIAAGDAWAAANVPALIAYTHTHDAVLLLVWDEGDQNRLIPFIAIGDHVVKGASATMYTQSSQLATVEELLGLPRLPSVATAPDFAPMFEAGYLTP
jgi:hypothetical protein